MTERLCPACGSGVIRPMVASGRAMGFKQVPGVELPADFPVPTCTVCGVQALDKKLLRKMDRALDAAYRDWLAGTAVDTLQTLDSARVHQRELEIVLGLSPGYISKLKHRKETPSSPLVALLMLIAAAPSRLGELRTYWARGFRSTPRPCLVYNAAPATVRNGRVANYTEAVMSQLQPIEASARYSGRSEMHQEVEGPPHQPITPGISERAA